MEAQNKDLETEYSEAVEVIESWQSSHAQVQSECDQLRQELDQLKMSGDNRTEADTAESVEKAQARITELEATVKEMELRYKEKEEEYAALMAQRDATPREIGDVAGSSPMQPDEAKEDRAAPAGETNDEIDALQKALQAAKNEKDSLSEALASTQQRIESIEAETEHVVEQWKGKCSLSSSQIQQILS